jgi:hypothetical protein
MDEDYRFGYTEDELRRAAEDSRTQVQARAPASA